ncbi:glycoside hydrolase family 16 protein [Nocardioides guangzhouensis]|uniref:glycoside hydrolase family 16 protein n=1 Tax=Nocardioides guangzhouensis TaxID=2497878 RepID=UPI0014382B74|nr:glycoside hydrolase family 16 protein [Nocardioides guangzhouensis]
MLERQVGGSWERVDAVRQGREGRAEFTAPYSIEGEPVVYRATVVGQGGHPSLSSKPQASDRWGEPDFSDEFDGNALDDTWSNRLQGYLPDSHRACSKADDRAVGVSGGTVKLSVLLDPDRVGDRCASDEGNFAYRLNGHISTEQSRSFLYGYFAARVKFQHRRGQHGAFWLQVKSRAATTGPATQTGSEVDVIEWFGHKHPSGGLTSFVYDYPTEAGRKTGGFVRKPERFGDDWASTFHVFSVEWTPRKYVFRIDGQRSYQTDRGVSGRPEFMILSLLSSDYEIPHLGKDSRLPQTMAVDWVRHWPLSHSGVAPPVGQGS